jgi:hypothetical protein
MAARKHVKHDDKTRAKIKTSQLINRLTDHILETDRDRLMSASQVTAALGLIKKTLPDLQSTELTGSDGGPVQSKRTIEFVNVDAATSKV